MKINLRPLLNCFVKGKFHLLFVFIPSNFFSKWAILLPVQTMRNFQHKKIVKRSVYFKRDNGGVESDGYTNFWRSYWSLINLVRLTSYCLLTRKKVLKIAILGRSPRNINLEIIRKFHDYFFISIFLRITLV